MLLSIEGEEKTIKTTVALTAPLPIVLFAFDIGAERAVNGTQFDKYFKGLRIKTVKYNRFKPAENIIDQNNPPWIDQDITIFELPQPVQLDSNNHTGYRALWEYFITYCGLAASSDTMSTIILDTATIARRVKTDAYLEELNDNAKISGKQPRKQLLQIEYGHPNDAMRNIYSTMASIGKNFIAVHHLTEEYKPQMVNGTMESSPTGNRVLEGLTGSYRYFDVCLRNGKDNKGNPNSKIIVCGYDLGLEGLPVPANDWNSLVELIEMRLGNRISFDKRVTT